MYLYYFKVRTIQLAKYKKQKSQKKISSTNYITNTCFWKIISKWKDRSQIGQRCV